METPSYRWTCHKCDRVNNPGAPLCSSCGFPAVATACEIAKAKGETDPAAEGYKALGKGTGWLAYFVGLFMS